MFTSEQFLNLSFNIQCGLVTSVILLLANDVHGHCRRPEDQISSKKMKLVKLFHSSAFQKLEI